MNPILGMTNANMKLVVLNVPLEDKMETPDAQLDAGEFIVKRVVELAKLNDELKGIVMISIQYATVDVASCQIQHTMRRCQCNIPRDFMLTIQISQGFVVDARLSHFASGYEMAQRIRNSQLN
jgi:ADP-ribose pyrophosphatase